MAYLIFGFQGLGVGERRGGKEQGRSGDIMFKFSFNVRFILHFIDVYIVVLKLNASTAILML